MTIYIAHLYYDLLNLYGEVGNVKVIKELLAKEQIKVVIDNLTIGDDIDFNKYDLIYLGCGTEENLLTVLNDILKYRDDIKSYIESNKFILATGNSYELFGNMIDEHNALKIFDYNARRVDKRIVGDSVLKCNFIDDDIIGFSNRGSIIENNNSYLFDIVSCNEKEGIHYKNFYGTYFIGPLLARNPKLTEYLLTKLIKSKNPKFKIKKFDLEFDKKAYETYMKTYHKC